MVFSFLGGDEGGGFSWLVGVVVVVRVWYGCVEEEEEEVEEGTK